MFARPPLRIAATAGRAAGVDGRQPEVEREQAELDAERDEEADRDQDRGVRVDVGHALGDPRHVERAGDVVEAGDREQEHERPEQVDRR